MNPLAVFKAPRWQFAVALLGDILRGRLSMPKGDIPPVGHVVPETFAGVGIAAAADPAVDDWLIGILHNAGIRNVRLDFTYGDADGPAARLLDKLLDHDFRILLHLVQPATAAREMPGVSASTDWKNFLVATLDRFGRRVWRVEVGSTVNRKRWAGYSLAGFLGMWEIAWKEIRQRELTLAGPSVTDFEPPWNIGLLALLQRRKQLPDIHTDNLFAERSTEPERFDHKIFGRSLAWLHRINLIKKARLLARIGAAHGVPRFFSPAAFWTLPRIERMLPDSEQKQADYLARYMVLCAASGALEGAWWGPLVCHREGLVDDGEMPYPALERITHYASITGNLADFRVRPALAALSTFNRMLPCARYEGRLSRGQGLEIHAFSAVDRIIHVVWTRNGAAAALVDIYAADDLSVSQVLSRDGVPVENAHRMLVTESPLYLVWPDAQPVTLKPGASVLRGLAIHRHVADKDHYFFSDASWRGIVLAKDIGEAEKIWCGTHPEHLGAPPAEALLRKARNVIWKVPDPRFFGAQLVVKKPVKMHLHKQFLDRFKPSKAMRSWSGTCELLRRGIAAAPPVAFFEKIGDRSLRENFYVCEYVQADYTAREMVAAFVAGQQSFAGVNELSAYQLLASYLLRMHGGGLLFRDLSGGNILVQSAEKKALEFTLIDTGRIRVFSQPLSLSQRADDLVRICNKMTWEQRKSFLTVYMTTLGKSTPWWFGLPFLIYDLKVVLKRKIGRKAWKKLLGMPS